MFSYERSVNYPDGHRNVIFARRGIHTLPRFDPLHLTMLRKQAAMNPRPTPKCFTPT
jgi:hypothetical protein